MSQPAEHDVRLVAMIAEARKRGLTWAQIGSATIGRPDPKAAKNHARKLARRANKAAALMLGREAPGA
jgi:hypothetical protein